MACRGRLVGRVNNPEHKLNAKTETLTFDGVMGEFAKTAPAVPMMPVMPSAALVTLK